MLFHSRTADTAGFPETPGENINDGRTHAFQQSSRRQYPGITIVFDIINFQRTSFMVFFYWKSFLSVRRRQMEGGVLKFIILLAGKSAASPPALVFLYFLAPRWKKNTWKQKISAELRCYTVFCFHLACTTVQNNF